MNTKPVLVVYATREGHTRRVAEYLATVLGERGLATRVIAAASPPGDLALSDYSAAVLAASVHVGQHEPELVDFVIRHREALGKLPTAFLSVSMAEAAVEDPHATSARRHEAEENVERTIERFCQQTDWRPERIKPVAGALLYTQYGLITRLVMKMIAKRAGGPSDTSHDHDLTDWKALARFAEEFADELAA